MAISVKNLDLNNPGKTGKKVKSVAAASANDQQHSSGQKTKPPQSTQLSFSDFGKKKLTADDRMFFTEQLSLLLDTGNSLVESLQALSSQGQSPALQSLIEKLCEDLQSGQSFSQALSKHPEFFSATYCNLVKASEQGGFMADVLEELQLMDERRAKLQATVQSSLAYPAFLAGFSVLVVVFVLVFVFPKFGDMFGNMQASLPTSTRYLMAFSNSIISYWPWYVGGLGIFIAAWWSWAKSTSGRLLLDGLKLNAPVAKSVFAELYLVQSMRVMGLSLDKGVSVVDTLESCRDVVDNQHYRQFFRDMQDNVKNGSGLAVGFRASPFIPDLVKQMVTTGEASGNLPKVMNRIASYYERQLEKRLNMLSKAAEPVMLLIMGVIVGVLVSSLILPIFQMSKVTG